MNFIIFPIIAYLLGSIPTAIWIGKSWYHIDVREHGSKNAGATNTFRVLGKKPGIIVLLVDVLKGIIAVGLPFWFLQKDLDGEIVIDSLQIFCAFAAVVGHIYPVFAGFKGGKGVATSLGVVIGVQPWAAGICIVVFLIVFISFKYVSLGAIVAAVIFPLLVIFYFDASSWVLKSFSIVLSLMVIFAHRENVRRLLNGTENKMNLFKK